MDAAVRTAFKGQLFQEHHRLGKIRWLRQATKVFDCPPQPDQ